MASFRLPKDEAMQSVMRKTKHPLRASFRTIDAADYSEISTVELERSLVVGPRRYCSPRHRMPLNSTVPRSWRRPLVRAWQILLGT